MVFRPRWKHFLTVAAPMGAGPGGRPVNHRYCARRVSRPGNWIGYIRLENISLTNPLRSSSYALRLRALAPLRTRLEIALL